MDDDLIAYLEKKVKTLEAERDHWKANHDNQVKLKQEITQRPSRFVEMVNEIESLKAELAVTPHWVPAAEFKAEEDVEHAIVFCASLYNPQCDPVDSEAIRLAHHRRDGSWAFSKRFANATVTHVLAGLNPPVSNEDPRGDGDQ